MTAIAEHAAIIVTRRRYSFSLPERDTIIERPNLNSPNLTLGATPAIGQVTGSFLGCGPKCATPSQVSIMAKLSHLTERGDAVMVDVSGKASTARSAVAEGFVAMSKATLALAREATAKKGGVLAAARIAGIMAAKKTSELIPLCHPLILTKATVDFSFSDTPSGITVRAEVKVDGQTGVEMEALTAVSIACLTIYDMLKASEKSMTIGSVRLLEKTGGKSGSYIAAGKAAS
jgi:cyclic pyranopterin phosphate synthase